MKDRLYIGVDVGGTKISAGVVTPKGKILHWEKCPTPQRANARTIYNTIVKTLNDLLNAENLQPQNLAGIGLGIPGIVNPQSQKILVTPNIQLAGFPLAEELGKKFSVPIVMDNDVNVGLLGEKWLGAAQNTRNVVGLFPGTGIGGAIIVNDKLFSGSHGAAAELGHMIVDPDGPVCSCGNQGCLEALASRWAIERDIRAAIKKGERTMIFDLMRDNEGVIKSRFLKQAIAQQDRLILAILEKVAVTLGKACVSIRHILDPEIIVLGGGVIEACSDFILPRIQKELQADPFFTPKIGTCPIFASQLGDDAIILGAVALVKQHQTMSSPASPARESLPIQIRSVRPGEVSINGKIYRQDIYLLPDGKVKKRNKKIAKKFLGTADKLGPVELAKLSRKKPGTIIIGSGYRHRLSVTLAARKFLREKNIPHTILPTPQAIQFYNKTTGPKAGIFHLTGD